MWLYTQSIFICDYIDSPNLYVIIHTVQIYMWLYTQSIVICDYTDSPNLYVIIHTVQIYMWLYRQSIFIYDYTHSPYLYVIIHTVHIYMWLYTQSIFICDYTHSSYLYVIIHTVHILSDPHCLSLPFGPFIVYNLVYPVAYSHTSYWIACLVCVLLVAINNPFCKIHMLSTVPKRSQFCEMVTSWVCPDKLDYTFILLSAKTWLHLCGHATSYNSRYRKSHVNPHSATTQSCSWYVLCYEYGKVRLHPVAGRTGPERE